jgi:hypothetical protein
MLTDPEHYEEWSDEVWAKTPEEAEKLCQSLAGHALTEILQVTQKTKSASRNGTFKFVCWFKTEQASYDTSDSDSTD